jgi:hypothetical protein
MRRDDGQRLVLDAYAEESVEPSLRVVRHVERADPRHGHLVLRKRGEGGGERVEVAAERDAENVDRRASRLFGEDLRQPAARRAAHVGASPEPLQRDRGGNGVVHRTPSRQNQRLVRHVVSSFLFSASISPVSVSAHSISNFAHIQHSANPVPSEKRGKIATFPSRSCSRFEQHVQNFSNTKPVNASPRPPAQDAQDTEPHKAECQ